VGQLVSDRDRDELVRPAEGVESRERADGERDRAASNAPAGPRRAQGRRTIDGDDDDVFPRDVRGGGVRETIEDAMELVIPSAAHGDGVGDTQAAREPGERRHASGER